MSKAEQQEASTATLGAHLARLRGAAKLSLREVEDATNNEVSNAYLSQLEKNKILKPSPNILHALARVYSTSYEDLMRRAGIHCDDVTLAPDLNMETFETNVRGVYVAGHFTHARHIKAAIEAPRKIVPVIAHELRETPA